MQGRRFGRLPSGANALPVSRQASCLARRGLQINNKELRPIVNCYLAFAWCFGAALPGKLAGRRTSICDELGLALGAHKLTAWLYSNELARRRQEIAYSHLAASLLCSRPSRVCARCLRSAKPDLFRARFGQVRAKLAEGAILASNERTCSQGCISSRLSLEGQCSSSNGLDGIINSGPRASRRPWAAQLGPSASG